jgi:eukaryotic-like serine/threonine-protein kinase
MRFGDYEIISQLAIGGMSEVFLARRADAPPDTAERVVIKRILPVLTEDVHFVELFQEEARISRLMNHPNVVRVLDSGTIGAQPYIAMEHVDGVDCWRMAHRCASKGRPPPAVLSIFIGIEVLRALDHVHNAVDDQGRKMKVVHGDVSPTNIYISRTGQVKLGDFGIARARHRNLSRTRSMLQGKVAYMAPEQVLGTDVDHRADLFSTGTVLTELLIHTRLFGGGSQLTTLLAIRDVRLDVMESNRGKLPEGIEPLLRRALARDREERFPTAVSMARMLERFLGEATADDLRARLAEQVAVALELEPAARASVPKPRLTPIPTPVPIKLATDEQRAPSLPAEPMERLVDDEQLVQEEVQVIVELDDEEERPSRRTPVGTLCKFTFRRADGSIIGPLSLAAAIEEVASDKIRSIFEVSVDGGPFRPMSEVTELARHSPSLTPVTKELARVGPPDRRGLLGEDETVWGVFFRLALARESGIAIFDLAAVRKEVFLREGKIYCVKSNVSGELLGNALVERGVIDRAQLEFALEALPQFNNHLGDALVGLHMIDSVTLFRYISEQVTDRLLDIFTWRAGEYAFYRGAELPHAVFPLHVEIRTIVWQGIRKAFTDTACRSWLDTHASWTIAPAAASPAELSELELPEGPASVLSLVKRPMTIDLVAKLVSAEGEEIDVARALRLAIDTGLFVLAAPKTSPAPPSAADR